MKSIGFIFAYLGTGQARRSLRILGWMLGILALFVVLYSVAFHQVMEYEGQRHSWATAVYWTLVTMSTLGFGDITFESDLGRAFSVLVLLSGSVFILVLLPFTFIQFVFLPWMESSRRSRAPRQVPKELEGHVVVTGTGAIESSLVPRLVRAGIPYYLLISDVDEALRLNDEGLTVMVGDLDDPEALRAAGVDRAALVATTESDTRNTNIAFTVREISESVTVVATADSEASVDILELAGCDQVLQLGDMLGSALARRVLLPDGRSHVIGEFGELLVAEAAAPRQLIGIPLQSSELRRRTGVTVAGVWHRGQLSVARPSTVLSPSSTLIIAGSRAQLDTYDGLYGVARDDDAPVLIVGGGRVGRAAGRALGQAGLDCRIVEKERARVPQGEGDRYVVGDAADLEVLRRAGIDDAPTVMITTHDDDMNVYLTIYCRRLRPDVQIIARARLDRNVSTLHRAGADAVLSYASTGANAIWNLLTDDTTLQLAEGLDVFRVPVPAALVGKTLRESGIREATGCTVVALTDAGRFQANPSAAAALAPTAELVLIGDERSGDRFFRRFGSPEVGGRRRVVGRVGIEPTTKGL